MCFEAHNFLRFRRINHDYDLWEYINTGVLNDADTGLQSSNTTLRIMRSEFYWFTEICNSQCLSHFAASFIVSRAEESTVKGRFFVLYQWLSCTLTSSLLSFYWMRDVPTLWERHQQVLTTLMHVSVDMDRVLRSNELLKQQVWMILPQVHLRKPCYDLSFL